MTIDESARLYLEDYYLLEQARTGAHRHLEAIVSGLSAALQEELRQRGETPIRFGTYMQKGGGYLEVSVKKQDFPALDKIGKWKYYICYRDATTTDKLSRTTKCRIFGWSPKSHSALRDDLEASAKSLGLPSPYLDEEFDLLGESVEDVVEALTAAVVLRMDSYTRMVQALAGA